MPFSVLQDARHARGTQIYMPAKQPYAYNSLIKKTKHYENNSILKWAMKLNRVVKVGDANGWEIFVKCWTAWVIRDMQIKTLRFHPNPFGMAKLKASKQAGQQTNLTVNASRLVVKRDFVHCTVQTCTASMETGMKILQNVRNRSS